MGYIMRFKKEVIQVKGAYENMKNFLLRKGLM